MHLLMLNNFVLAEDSSEVFVSYGKVITNKDGIVEIVGLEDVVSGEVIRLNSIISAVGLKTHAAEIFALLQVFKISVQIEDKSYSILTC